MKLRYYIIIGIVSYLLFTLSNVPASRVISLAKSSTNLPAEFRGTYGSLWKGGADSLLIQDAPQVENLQWDINPLSLLVAQLSGDIHASVKQQSLVGAFSVGPTGQLKLSDIRARISGEVMQELIQMPLGELGGVFNIDIASAESLNQPVPSVDGRINWKSAQLTLAETVDLGHINIDITPSDNDSLSVKISNKGGQVSISGNATLAQNKQYTIDLRMTPEDGATQNIRQSLAMFARRQTDGSYQLKRNGNLKEFGI